MIEILSDEKSLGYVDQQRYVDPRRVTKEFYIASANIKTDNFHVFIYVMRNDTLKAYLSEDPLIIPPEGVAIFDNVYDTYTNMQRCMVNLSFASQVELTTNINDMADFIGKDECIKKILLVDKITEHAYRQYMSGVEATLSIRMNVEDISEAFSISTLTYTINEY